jgi:prepilin-type N-terminal cleavage/methylation domain-containing protein
MYITKLFRAFTLVELLVVIAIIGVLIAMLLPAIQAAREAARRSQCSNQFKNHVLALHNYHDVNFALPYGGTFDPSDASWYATWLRPSWFCRTLPFIEQQSLFETLKPVDWSLAMGDTEGGRTVLTTLLMIHVCPSDKVVMNEPNQASWARYRSNYVLCFGATNYSHTAVDAANDPNDPTIEPFLNKMAAFDPTKCTGGLENVSDGLSNTFFISEVVPSKSEQVAGLYGDVRLAASAGFTAYWLPNAAGPDRVASCNNTLWGKDVVKTGQCVDAGDYGTTYVHTARSWHPGGIQVALGDGSCRFISQTIAPLIWRGSSTASDGYGGNF